jgi:hypothetical protein
LPQLLLSRCSWQPLRQQGQLQWLKTLLLLVRHPDQHAGLLPSMVRCLLLLHLPQQQRLLAALVASSWLRQLLLLLLLLLLLVQSLGALHVWVPEQFPAPSRQQAQHQLDEWSPAACGASNLFGL